MKTSLQQLLADAQTHVPLYRDMWSDSGIDAGRLRLPGDLVLVPVLTKDALRQRGADNLLDARYPAEVLGSITTSGSTGQPLRVWRDQATLRRRQKRTFAGLWYAGHRPWHRFLWLELLPPGSRKKSSLIRRLMRIRYLDLASPEPQILQEYSASQADLVYGQFSALAMIAHGLAPDAPRPRPALVVGFGEQLTASIRQPIETALGTGITEFYGIAEVGLIACRKRGDRHYHQVGNDLLLEFLPSAEAPGYERLLVTTLHACPMPFIRYDTGDLVRRDLGAPGQPIVEIAGRALDFLKLPDGKRVAPYLVDNVLDEIPELRQYRVVQQQDMSVDVHLEVEDATLPAIEDQIREAMETLCGRQVPVRLHHHPHLPLTVGKLRFIQSLVR